MSQLKIGIIGAGGLGLGDSMPSSLELQTDSIHQNQLLNEIFEMSEIGSAHSFREFSPLKPFLHVLRLKQTLSLAGSE